MASSLIPPGQPSALGPGEFVPSQPANVVSFALKQVGPPSTLYVRPEEGLLVTVVPFTANTTVRVSFRFLLASGELHVGSQDFIAVTANQPNSFFIQFAEGYLLGVRATDPIGSVQRGQAWVRVELVRGTLVQNLPVQTLIANYMAQQSPPSWPGGSLIAPGDGSGWIRTFNQSNPSAGADIVISLPNLQRSRFGCMQAQLTTSAVVASRIVRVRINDNSGQNVWQSAATAAIPASTTASVSVGPGQSTSVVDATTINVPLPGNLMTGPGYSITTNTLNKDVGDQWSGIFVQFETWSAGN